MIEFILWLAITGGNAAPSQQAVAFRSEAACEAARRDLVAKLPRPGQAVVGVCVRFGDK